MIRQRQERRPNRTDHNLDGGGAIDRLDREPEHCQDDA